MNYGTPLCPSNHAANLSTFDALRVAHYVGHADRCRGDACLKERSSCLLPKKRQAPLHDEHGGAYAVCRSSAGARFACRKMPLLPGSCIRNTRQSICCSRYTEGFFVARRTASSAGSIYSRIYESCTQRASQARSSTRIKTSRISNRRNALVKVSGSRVKPQAGL